MQMHNQEAQEVQEAARQAQIEKAVQMQKEHGGEIVINETVIVFKKILWAKPNKP